MRGLKAIMRAAFCRPSFAGPLALLLAALTMLPAGLVHAVCICGFSDGQFTTHTGIVLDGNLADWAPVLADPDNNTCDGPSGGLPDLDEGGDVVYENGDEDENVDDEDGKEARVSGETKTKKTSIAKSFKT